MKLRFASLSMLLATAVIAAPPAKQPSWKVFVEPGGSYKIKYPPGWQVLTKGTAVVITSPGGPEERGVFGITLRGEGTTIQDSVNKEFEDTDHSSDLKQSPAKIADSPAIKVWGSKKGDPSIRIVEYYVQRGDRQYYILFQAPHDAMTRYSQHFNAMIGSMKFLE